jgi:thiol-disulfide isomerase/thioredoxin
MWKFSTLALVRRAALVLWLAFATVFTASAYASNEAVRWPEGQPTPELSLADSKGREWKLADLRGKVVIINFWASWCEPCRAEMPSLQSLAELYGADLVVLAVNFKERDNKVAQFAQAAGLSLPMPMDRDGAVAARWGVKVFPSSIMVGRDGKARTRVTGEVDWTGREAARWLEPLLK